MSDRTQLTERAGQSLSRNVGSATPHVRAVLPPVDLYEDNNGVTLWADLPGVSRERLDIRVQDGSLLLEAEGSVQPPQGLRVNHADLHQPCFTRAFALSPDFEASRIDAKLSDGILKTTIPKREEARPAAMK